ncbi:MAG: terpene cyclase/mutase family protein [Oscillospiraceae bacterium]|nr:terpene cyclase/mutase family protein [Oscillospiraceae bacterium]
MITRVFSKRILKAGCVFLGTVLLFCCVFSVSYAQNNSSQLQDYINSTLDARFSHTDFFDESEVGSTMCDWIAFAMGRYAIVYNDGKREVFCSVQTDEYADAAEKYLRDFYETSGVKTSVKLTEYFRTAITLTALGRDVSDIIKAVTLNNPVSLSRLAVMTLSYALIALEISDIKPDEGSVHTEQEFIDRLISLQLDDGGWSLTPLLAGSSDVDVTAITLQALAPFFRAGNKDAVSAVDKALVFLSSRQRSSGDFASYGVFNAESTSQVLVALTELGINFYSDERFIKDGNTVLDGLLLYRLSDGSFTHAFTKDDQNASAVPGAYNYLATDQAAYALVSCWRQQTELNSLYNMRVDVSDFADVDIVSVLSSLRELLFRLVYILFSEFITL